MSLPASGTISFDQINTELGRSSTASINLNDSAVRTLFGQASGVIDMNTGHGKSNTVSYNLTITANIKNYNLHNALITAGWNGTATVTATVTINSGIIVGSTTVGGYAFDTGVIPAGSNISIVNNGYITGFGGSGGLGATSYSTGVHSASGQAGGPSIYLRCPVSITNGSGYIYSGGGGGGGGGAHGGISAGGSGGVGAGSNYGLTYQGLGLNYTHGGAGNKNGAGVGLGGALGVNGATGKTYAGNGFGGGGGGGGGGASGGHGGNGGGSSGGGHGAAITSNGNSITWISGNARVYGGII